MGVALPSFGSKSQLLNIRRAKYSFQVNKEKEKEKERRKIGATG
jgi:hypothetical protein